MITPHILAMYLGQKCFIPQLHSDNHSDCYATIEIITNKGTEVKVKFETDVEGWVFYKDIKLILRPLSSISDTECVEIFNAMPSIVREYLGIDASLLRIKPSEFLELTKRGFDLFNLIENGLAIDATTLKD